MPLFWWVLSTYAPARPSELGEEFSELNVEGIDDALHRLYLLSGLGAVRRLAYGRYELTPLGTELASLLSKPPEKVDREIHVAESNDGVDFSTLLFDL